MVRHRQANDQTQTDKWSDTDRQADGQTQTDEMIRHRQMRTDEMVRHRQMRWSDTDRQMRWSDTDRWVATHTHTHTQMVRHRQRDSRTDQGICEETESPLGAKTVHMTGQRLCYHADVGCQFLFINSLSRKHKWRAAWVPKNPPKILP